MNSELAKIFNEMAALMEMKGVEFKPRAFENAAYSLDGLEEDVKTIYERDGMRGLLKIPSVGQGMAKKIEEYIKTGHIKEYEALKKKIPVDITGLTVIEGVGPKTVLKLYREFGIKNVADLEKLAKEGKLKGKGLGPKTADNILRGIGFLKTGSGRFILGFILPTAKKIKERLEKAPGVERVEFAGSIRRMQETVGDLDILVISKKPKEVMDFFVSMPEVQEIFGKGPTKTNVRLKIGMDADLRVLPPKSFGAALQYFTGDKYHNVALREIAIKKGYKLSEYGLFKGKKQIAGESEKEVYEKLGLDWMEPEMRRNNGELDAALWQAQGKPGGLPELIDYGDVKGDLQVQTDWTDGASSIKEMALAAQKAGLEYIVITDHTKSLAMTGGLDDKKLLKQMAEIDKVQKQVSGIKILKGSEVNILKDGTLDISDEVLEKLNVVGAAVHSHFNLTEKEMTERIIRAMENPNVDIIFHPTGRIIQKRDAYKLNMDEIFKTAKKTKTVLEIDAYPSRLDLKDEHIRKAVEMGIKLSIDTDAHHISHFQYLELGIAQARRGWAEAKDVINTRDWKQMLSLLKK